MVNQVYRLMESGVARRVLFLVDRRALAAQAVRAFNSFEPEPGKKFHKLYEIYSSKFDRCSLKEYVHEACVFVPSACTWVRHLDLAQHHCTENTAIEMASALVAERQDGTRVFPRYFPTGEIQQWSDSKAGWVTLGACTPRGANPFSTVPQCSNGPLRLLRE